MTSKEQNENLDSFNNDTPFGVFRTKYSGQLVLSDYDKRYDGNRELVFSAFILPNWLFLKSFKTKEEQWDYCNKLKEIKRPENE